MQWNLAALFELVAATVPDREAIVCGSRRLNYAELDERANRLANHLSEAGIRAGDHIGVLLYNSSEYIETMVAAFKLGAVPVNINYRYVAGELHYVFTDADVRAVVHEDGFEETLRDLVDRLPLLDYTLSRGDEYEQALASAPAARPHDGARTGDDLYILYTGGTTGEPKGVMWRQEDVFFAAMGGTADLADANGAPDKAKIIERARAGRQRLLPACPFMHGTAHWMAFSTLFSGGTVVVSDQRQLDARDLLDLCRAESVSFLVIVGDAFARPIVDALDDEPADGLDALSVIMSGGATLSPFLKERLTALLPAAIVVDGYGASETGGQGSMVTAPGGAASRPRFRVNAETAVLDENLEPVAPGSGRVGRLARRGHIPIGYYKDPARSALTFPTARGVRWAIPGDLAEVDDDGTIVLYGRGSLSINTGGEKVYPEEVEGVMRSHPDVFDALVVGVPDHRWGEVVTGLVQPRASADFDTDDLIAYCRERLAAFKVPRSVVVVDEVVRSPAGKPDYRWARSLASA